MGARAQELAKTGQVTKAQRIQARVTYIAGIHFGPTDSEMLTVRGNAAGISALIGDWESVVTDAEFVVFHMTKQEGGRQPRCVAMAASARGWTHEIRTFRGCRESRPIFVVSSQRGQPVGHCDESPTQREASESERSTRRGIKSRLLRAFGGQASGAPTWVSPVRWEMGLVVRCRSSTPSSCHSRRTASASEDENRKTDRLLRVGCPRSRPEEAAADRPPASGELA